MRGYGLYEDITIIGYDVCRQMLFDGCTMIEIVSYVCLYPYVDVSSNKSQYGVVHIVRVLMGLGYTCWYYPWGNPYPKILVQCLSHRDIRKESVLEGYPMSEVWL